MGPMGKVNRVPVICQWQSAVESGIVFGLVGIVVGVWGALPPTRLGVPELRLSFGPCALSD